jgi:hypothetical protein
VLAKYSFGFVMKLKVQNRGEISATRAFLLAMQIDPVASRLCLGDLESRPFDQRDFSTWTPCELLAGLETLVKLRIESGSAFSGSAWVRRVFLHL